MAISIDGLGNVTTPGNTGDDRNITVRYGISVVGLQPTWQQPNGVVTIAQMAAIQPAPPSSSKYSIASYNTYTPASYPGVSTGGASEIGTHAEFRTAPAVMPYTTGPTGFVPGWTTSATRSGGIEGFNGVVNYYTTSDYRLKKDITPIENGLDYIMPLRPRRFSWSETGSEVLGFIAHEIQEDAPPFLADSVVTGKKDGKNVFVNLYKDGEIMLDDSGKPIERIIPEGLEIDMLKLEGVTWTVVREEVINQSIDVTGFISPIVASVQELKYLTDLRKEKINNLKSRIKILEEKF